MTATFRTAFMLLCFSLPGCAAEPEPSVIERAITYQGGGALDQADVRFDFRGRSFQIYRDRGQFRYERAYVDSTGAQVVEVLNNEGLARTVNGRPVVLTEERNRAYQTSVNSVVYFALLPYPLRDPGAVTRSLGTGRVGGRLYNKVEVTFTPEDGGLDYEDRFVYWFDQATGGMKYIAYYYHTEGGGARFREVVRERRVGGVVFSDHLNYRAVPDTVDMDDVHLFDRIFESGGVEQVSVVVLDSLSLSTVGGDFGTNDGR